MNQSETGMNKARKKILAAGSRLEDAAVTKVIATFHKDGFVVLRQVVDHDIVNALRELADEFLDRDRSDLEVTDIYGASVLRNTQSLSPLFSEFVAYPPFVQVTEAILGTGFGFCGQNVIRSDGGEAISTWHTDDVTEFLVPDEIERHDARMIMPLIWYSIQIPLSDIDSVEDGATEIVPSSHYSGRNPPRCREEPDENDPPIFDGQLPVPVLVKAGDIYLFNHQTWHRGAPNISGKRRYLMQNQYSRDWVARRFGPGSHRDCDLPSEEAEQLSDTAREILRLGARRSG
jgi:ectoine hydroxylase-related dioxygenase (phytanoyl-CoA dioxygenase family)